MSRPSKISDSASAAGSGLSRRWRNSRSPRPQQSEELAEDPRPLGVDLQRALPIGEPGHAHVPVLEAAHRLAVAKDGAGAAEVERVPRRQRVAQVVADVKDEEERQQRARHGDHRMAATRMWDVRELVHDACRVAGGSVGLGRIGHVSGVARNLAQVPRTTWNRMLDLLSDGVSAMCGGWCGSDRACSSRWRCWRCRWPPRAASTSRRRPRRPSSGSPPRCRPATGRRCSTRSIRRRAGI